MTNRDFGILLCTALGICAAVAWLAHYSVMDAAGRASVSNTIRMGTGFLLAQPGVFLAGWAIGRFLDIDPEQAPRRRTFAALAVVGIVLGVLGYTVGDQWLGPNTADGVRTFVQAVSSK